MNRRWAIVALGVALGVLPRVAAAHDGHIHKIMGTVTARDAKHLEVDAERREPLNRDYCETVVTRDKRKVSVTEVQVGRRVVVEIGNGEDPLIAGAIQVGASAPSTSAAAH